MKATILTVLVLLFALPVLAQEPVIETEHMRVYAVKGEFATYREAVEMGITNRGMVINNVAHIGAMLARTAADVSGSAIYDEGQALEFCSAVVSRRMMEADPHNIVFCPYIIAVYTLEQTPDEVFISYRRPVPVGSAESRASLGAVETLLEEIVQEALDAF